MSTDTNMADLLGLGDSSAEATVEATPVETAEAADAPVDPTLVTADVAAPQPSAPLQTAEVADAMKARDALLATATQQIQQLQNQQTQMNQQMNQQPAQTQEEYLNQLYNYNVDQEVVANIRGEDPAAASAALTQALNEIGRRTHQNIMNDVVQMNQQMQERMADQSGQQIQAAQQKQQVESDFYGTYPGLNKPEIRPIVESVAKQVATELGATQWSDQLKQAIGARVVGVLQAASGQNQQVPAQPQQPFMAGSAPARAPVKSTNPNSPAEIAKLMLG